MHVALAYTTPGLTVTAFALVGAVQHRVMEFEMQGTAHACRDPRWASSSTIQVCVRPEAWSPLLPRGVLDGEAKGLPGPRPLLRRLMPALCGPGSRGQAQSDRRMSSTMPESWLCCQHQHQPWT